MDNKILKMEIKDNGVGFDTRSSFHGIGLKNMKSRAKAIGGEFYLISTAKTGTQIIITVPLP